MAQEWNETWQKSAIGSINAVLIYPSQNMKLRAMKISTDRTFL